MASDAPPPPPSGPSPATRDEAGAPPPPPAAATTSTSTPPATDVDATVSPAPAPPRPRSPLATGVDFAWRSRRALLLVTAAQLLFGLSVALPLRARVAPYLDAHPHASALASEPNAFDRAAGWVGGLDWSLMQDVRRKEAPFFDGLSLALAWIALAAWLFGQAVAGGLLATAHDDEALLAGGGVPASGASRRPTAARFLAGAGTWFFPMLRTSVAFLVLTEGVLRRLVFEAWGGAAAAAQSKAASDAVAWWGAREREAAYLVLFLALRAAADLGRAHLVVKGRRSAVLAFARGIATLVRHPLRAGGLAVLVAVPEMLLLAACAWLLARFPGGTPFHLIGAFLAFQLAVYVRWSARAALLAGDVSLVRRTTSGSSPAPAPTAPVGGPAVAPAPPTPSAPAPAATVAAATPAPPASPSQAGTSPSA